MLTSPYINCGVRTYSECLANALKNAGIDVDLRPMNDVPNDLCMYNVVHVQHEWGLLSYRDLPKYIDVLKARKAKKIVVTLHTVAAPMYNSVNRVVEGVEESGVERWLVRNVDAVIVLARLMRDALIIACGGNQGNIYVVEHGAPIICCGDIDRDIDVFIHAPSRQDVDWGVVESVVKGVDGKIFVHDRYMGFEDIVSTLCRSKIVLLPYIDIPGWFHTSGFAHLAIGCRCMVVSTSWIVASDLIDYIPMAYMHRDHVVDELNKMVSEYEKLVHFIDDARFSRSWRLVAYNHVYVYNKIISGGGCNV